MTKAMLSHAPGEPESLTLGDITLPVCGPGQVQIRIHACGVNYPDALMIADKYQSRPPRPFAPGGEVAGTIEAVGEGVAQFGIGDRVLAFVGLGGMAERALCDVGQVLPIPDGMPFEDAAAFLTTYGTSYYALKQQGRLQSGESLLVLGAAGGVGIAAVELAKAMGGTVVAAVSSEEKRDFALAAGADTGLIYPKVEPDAGAEKELAALFKAAAPETGFDLVYDAIGGAYSEAAFRAIAWGGRHLVIGFPSGIARLPLNLPLLKGAAILGVFYGSFTRREPETNALNNDELFAMYAKALIKPRISAVFPLEEAGAAIRCLTDRTVRGKVVIKIN
jgi:NADPH2:quinone reductase